MRCDSRLIQPNLAKIRWVFQEVGIFPQLAPAARAFVGNGKVNPTLRVAMGQGYRARCPSARSFSSQRA